MKKTLTGMLLATLSWFSLDYINLRTAVAQQEVQAAQQQKQATERYEQIRKQQADWHKEYSADKQTQIQTNSEILRALGRIEGKMEERK